MAGKLSYQQFHFIRRDVIAAGLPNYSFTDRESQGGRYVTSHRGKEVFLYLEDEEIFCLSPDEKPSRMPLTSVRKLYLGPGGSDWEVSCAIHRGLGRPIVFGDHSYHRGVDSIAEVLRADFRTFIEQIQRALIERKRDAKVTYEARGPASRGVGCLTAFTLLGLGPMLAIVWSTYWLDNANDAGEANSWIFAGVNLLLIGIGIFFSVFLNRILSPRIRFEKAKTPDAMFDAADAVITSECHRYQSALRFINYQIPKAEKGVYQSADAKGYQSRFQVTDKEVVFTSWKEQHETREERYRLGAIVSVNMNQPKMNFYTISITFYDGNTWLITTEDFNPSVGNQRAHADLQRARFRHWVDHLHRQLIDRQCSGRIAFTSGNSASYKLARVGLWLFNVFLFGTVALLIILVFAVAWSPRLLFSAVLLGLVGVTTNVVSSLLSTKRPTQPYSPVSLPWRHVPHQSVER